MIPAGRENSWLALLQVADRGTSFVAPLLFGLALSATGSYRVGLAALLILFVSGTALLMSTNTAQAIEDAEGSRRDSV